MIREETVHHLENGYHVTIRYIREHWHEWLWLYVEEGCAVPHFYLPTHRKDARFGFIAWIIPLAPFVLLIIAIWRAYLAFWGDCLWAIEKWRDIKRPPSNFIKRI